MAFCCPVVVVRVMMVSAGIRRRKEPLGDTGTSAEDSGGNQPRFAAVRRRRRDRRAWELNELMCAVCEPASE